MTPLTFDRPDEQTRARPDCHQAISILDLFTIGIGPSSSHTVGPMRAAWLFADLVADEKPVAVRVDLYGSLALTGRGHATDSAVMLGLSGAQPETIDPDLIPVRLAAIRSSGRLMLAERVEIGFEESQHLLFHAQTFLPGHPNAVTFTASFGDGRTVERTYFSIGGGAIVEAGSGPVKANILLPRPFSSGAELLATGDATGMTIADIVRENEIAWRPDSETDAFLDAVRAAMFASIDRGCRQGGILPTYRLTHSNTAADPSAVFEWVSLYALAVNEENAAGGRVVTAPTNGAAGVLPAVLRFYETFTKDPTPKGAHDFLLTAAAIGFLYKKRASISAAEMGCQGEVGVACSMAAGALVAALGGTNEQIENAAEIGMEHNLGLTCDPIGGLVQIPCIERNTMGAIKAINAAYLALRGDGRHIVSLDAVIETMRQTGEDMRSQYKETSLGGLAVNVVEC
jgi:L-serine dehydratase